MVMIFSLIKLLIYSENTKYYVNRIITWSWLYFQSSSFSPNPDYISSICSTSSSSYLVGIPNITRPKENWPLFSFPNLLYQSLAHLSYWQFVTYSWTNPNHASSLIAFYFFLSHLPTIIPSGSPIGSVFRISPEHV